MGLTLGCGLYLILPHLLTLAPGPESDPKLQEEIKSKLYATIHPLDEAGFERKPAPKTGEWLASFPETAQTFERYRFTRHITPTAERRTIVLQPLGDFSQAEQQILEVMRDYSQVFFGLPARIAPGLPLPKQQDQDPHQLIRLLPLGQRHGAHDRQYHAGRILDRILRPNLPPDAVVCLGITMVDLFEADLNYVFGLGSIVERVGVYSLCRYYPEFWNRARREGDELKGLLRACKVLNHETGHMFGISHCVFYQCSMNGSNSLPETDAAPIHFCPLCHRKLQHALQFDPLERYRKLQAFYEKAQLKPEAEWVSKRLKNYAQYLQIRGTRKPNSPETAEE